MPAQPQKPVQITYFAAVARYDLRMAPHAVLKRRALMDKDNFDKTLACLRTLAAAALHSDLCLTAGMQAAAAFPLSSDASDSEETGTAVEDSAEYAAVLKKVGRAMEAHASPARAAPRHKRKRASEAQEDGEAPAALRRSVRARVAPKRFGEVAC